MLDAERAVSELFEKLWQMTGLMLGDDETVSFTCPFCGSPKLTAKLCGWRSLQDKTCETCGQSVTIADVSTDEQREIVVRWHDGENDRYDRIVLSTAE